MSHPYISTKFIGLDDQGNRRFRISKKYSCCVVIPSIKESWLSKMEAYLDEYGLHGLEILIENKNVSVVARQFNLAAEKLGPKT